MFFEDIVQLQKNLDKLLGFDLSPSSTYARGMFPAINMFEHDDKVLLKTELPGMKKTDVKVELLGDKIVLSGERRFEEEERDAHYHRRERQWGVFSRQIKLPYRVDAEKILATMENGVLTIELEKAPEAKPRLINVR